MHKQAQKAALRCALCAYSRPAVCQVVPPNDRDFQSAAWHRLLSDMDLPSFEPRGGTPELAATHSTIASVIKGPALKKIGRLLVIIKSITVTDHCAEAMIKDPTGEMRACIHANVRAQPAPIEAYRAQTLRTSEPHEVLLRKNLMAIAPVPWQVLEEEGEALARGAVLVLSRVSVFNSCDGQRSVIDCPSDALVDPLHTIPLRSRCWRAMRLGFVPTAQPAGSHHTKQHRPVLSSWSRAGRCASGCVRPCILHVTEPSKRPCNRRKTQGDNETNPNTVNLYEHPNPPPLSRATRIHAPSLPAAPTLSASLRVGPGLERCCSLRKQVGNEVALPIRVAPQCIPLPERNRHQRPPELPEVPLLHGGRPDLRAQRRPCEVPGPVHLDRHGPRAVGGA